MHTLNRLMLVELLVFASLVTMATDDDALSGEPNVAIRQEDDGTIQEYHVNGFFYAIKVIPEHDKPCFLVRADGSDDNFVRSDQPDKLIP